MTATAKQLEVEMRKLPIEDLIELHERLIETVHRAVEELGLSPEWRDEIARRIKDIDEGRVTGIPVEETYQKIKRTHS
jgi:putative addiction module component (TIGR02574 family)